MSPLEDCFGGWPVRAHNTRAFSLQLELSLLKRLHFFPYPPINELCNHPPPPPRREHNCLLLTALKQSCPSRVAALQGCTAPVRHFPGCHSLGEHLLFSLSGSMGMHQNPSAPPSSKLRCPSTVRGAAELRHQYGRRKTAERHMRGSKQSSSDFIVRLDPPWLRLRHRFWQ